ncbi:ABC-type glycerol-3-phosphate transport system, substrate-binding protein [Cetobacterium ceti]|uniref:ABC-type glycerol-3-phosphate transport system, substrate-binding protein n=1 Tax=Cetobacterium ceti TaxID=180163 RepID=A0A1T4MWW4_9FUSO|nr:extracellular solute-binding protein [Cetobacterium ceti]SJZ71138.1 ABC-type glycerol-3-phosphate transport system, substrate-binding protein [Cetobacterium ceti]
MNKIKKFKCILIIFIIALSSFFILKKDNSENINLRIGLLPEMPYSENLIETFAKTFEKNYSNVKISIEILDYSSPFVFKNLKNYPDIIMVSYSTFIPLANRNILLPLNLTPYEKEIHNSKFIDIFNIKNNIYAIPLVENRSFLLYNKDMTNEIQLIFPTDIKNFYNLLVSLKYNNKNLLAPLVTSRNLDYLDDEKTEKMAKELEDLELYKIIHKMYKKNLFSSTNKNPLELFLNKEAALIPILNAKNLNIIKEMEFPFNYGINFFPLSDSKHLNTGLAVNRNSKNKKIALKFIKEVTSPFSEENYIQNKYKSNL